MSKDKHPGLPYATLAPIAIRDEGDTTPREHLSATGRARLAPPHLISHPLYAATLSKCVEAHGHSGDKKASKALMKNAVSKAASLMKSFGVDTSIIAVEVGPIPMTDVEATDGKILTAFLDAAAAFVVLDGSHFASLPPQVDVDRSRLAADFVSWNDEEDSKFDGDINAVSLLASTIVLPASSAADLPPIPPSTQLVVRLSSPAPQTVKDLWYPAGVRTLLGPSVPSPALLGSCTASLIRTDRPDGLYTTVVCGRAHGEALGLVYSSDSSIEAALACGRGVYWSRSRNGLWRKGDTSGYFQTLHRIDVDCDGDAVRFLVTQRGPSDKEPAFCHLETYTCWGASHGLNHLEAMLTSRRASAPEGSYTKRLFDDPELLRDKLVEEAQELAEATEHEDVAGELADVIYFAMARAVAAKVPLEDAIAVLDNRARKVTRRPGNSKVERIEAGKAILERAAQKDAASAV
mmetsp:Transcript_4851/g.9597  ORF Transcript_4851/g.9597 Transcript_4851/m.9597 type:complete len:463 (-) Transcript_4851:219-1607(-)